MPQGTGSTACQSNYLLRTYHTTLTILLKTLAYVRDIDGFTLYFDFQCFNFPLLIGDENQFWVKITKPQPGYDLMKNVKQWKGLRSRP